ncbi:tRNA (adenosine(37)-N6)-threonylcarbamoyltransferase complex transferase subunit TsaD [Roseimaritima sediminicola]|uniref:tRNA (adenosine(37)-N6)-threonylcarbamoyltransferase complex transferase subunit TsaD n=1 Tax=Roseimaritima sediminicola TaxID=2662066 RepID=UPI00129837EF|nr:tRNA (adenosine(37)-N6)-threonylcarbamoyltransferase complex transferase subunit TsaD [Roseimaritima sediminicola]
MSILTIESTCDETAAAVIARDGQVLGSALATQTELHEQYRGVVPEVAARAHVERILPVIDHALTEAQCDPTSLDAVAVAHTPGLAGSLLIGLTAAKTLAVAWQKPLITVNHLYAHIYACQLGRTESIYPCVGLIVSGGHTSLYDCLGPLELRYLGGTIDDAAGEAFDKVAAMLGLEFPGGPAVSRAALEGNPEAYRFPRSLLNQDNFDFSFSGLKTAVRYELVGPGEKDFTQLDLPAERVADICASFQQAVVDVLVEKSRRAVRHSSANRLCIGGGVAANRVLRTAFEQAADEDAFELIVAPPHLCTDNAVMGAIALEKLARDDFASLDIDIQPGLQRGH